MDKRTGLKIPGLSAFVGSKQRLFSKKPLDAKNRYLNRIMETFKKARIRPSAHL